MRFYGGQKDCTAGRAHCRCRLYDHHHDYDKRNEHEQM